MNIVGIAPFFPTPYRPELGVFIHSLFAEMQKQGNRVETIAPVPWTQRFVDPLVCRKKDINWIDQSTCRRPVYSNLPLHLLLGSSWSYRKVEHSFQRVVQKELKAIKGPIDWIYAHFLTSGLAAVGFCHEQQIPCIVGLGESSLKNIESLVGTVTFVEALQSFTGIVAVSKENERYCRERCSSLGERLVYIPNGVDTAKFYPRNRTDVRKQLGLPEKARIALFCGHFIERKGPLRVQEALESLPDVYGIFLGQGKQKPSGTRVLHASPVTHDQVPLWFAAADVFVLPSLAEGMSNAILEALASGLPLVVSDRVFNRDFLTSDCARFVDPLSPQAIANGIQSILSNNDQKEEMSRQSVLLAEEYSLSKRVCKINDFYNVCLKKV